MPQKIRETITFPDYRTVKVVFSEPVTLKESQLHLMDDYDPQDVYIESQSLRCKSCDAFLFVQQPWGRNNVLPAIFRR